MLWDAREIIDMYASVIRARSGLDPADLLKVRDRIDAYRAEQGRSPNGFGGEQ